MKKLILLTVLLASLQAEVVKVGHISSKDWTLPRFTDWCIHGKVWREKLGSHGGFSQILWTNTNKLVALKCADYKEFRKRGM